GTNRIFVTPLEASVSAVVLETVGNTCHVLPLSRLYCQIPLVWSACVIAMPWCWEPLESLIGLAPSPEMRLDSSSPGLDTGFSSSVGSDDVPVTFSTGA